MSYYNDVIFINITSLTELTELKLGFYPGFLYYFGKLLINAGLKYLTIIGNFLNFFINIIYYQ